MNTSRDLQDILRRIDRRGYPAYKDTRGSYQFHTPGGEAYILRIEHVQGDYWYYTSFKAKLQPVFSTRRCQLVVEFLLDKLQDF